MSGFLFTAGPFVVGAAADAAPLSGGGRLWLLNEGSREIRIDKILFSSQLGGVLATPTSPRFTLERFAFTGTPSGAQISPSKTLSSMPDATLKLRTANTGIAFTASSAFGIWAWLPVASATAVSFVSPTIDFVELPGILLPGQGMVVRQADAGTASDSRRVVINGRWSE